MSVLKIIYIWLNLDWIQTIPKRCSRCHGAVAAAAALAADPMAPSSRFREGCEPKLLDRNWETVFFNKIELVLRNISFHRCLPCLCLQINAE